MTSKQERIGLLALMAIAAALRLVHPGSDVPVAFEDTDAPVEDAFWYLEQAAARAEGVTAEVTGSIAAYEPQPWVSVARMWFQLAGPSVRSAGVLGGLASLVTVLLVWRLVRARLGQVAGLAAGAVIAALPSFVMLGRTTIIYGPATLALVAAAALWLRAREAPTRARVVLEVLAWALALGTAIMVRPPLAALCGGLFLAQLARAERPVRAAVVALVVSALVVGALYALDPANIVGLTRDRLSRYLARATPDAATGMPGLAGIVERLLRLGGAAQDGAGSGYLALGPGSNLLAALGLLLAWLRRRELGPGARETLALAAGWTLTLCAGAVVFDYRPLRYFVIIAPPIAALAGFAVAALARGRIEPTPASASAIDLVLVAAWGGVVGPHVGELIAGGPAGWSWTLAFALAGGILAVASVGPLSRRLPQATARTRARCAAIAAIVALAPDLASDALTLARPERYALEANRVAARIFGEGACVVGPLESLLTLGSGVDRGLAPWIRTGTPQLGPTAERLRGTTHVALAMDHLINTQFATRLRAVGLHLDLVAILPVRAGSWPAVIYRVVDTRRAYTPTLVEGDAPITDPALLLVRVRALAFEQRVAEANAAIERALRADPRLKTLEPALRRVLAGAERLPGQEPGAPSDSWWYGVSTDR